jgi:hypothetical protein
MARLSPGDGIEAMPRKPLKNKVFRAVVAFSAGG